jgi:RNA polymerase sigma-70 factor (sigma-E family)
LSGRHSTLTELVAARGHALKRYAYLLCGNDAEADDLVQDALVKVLARRNHGPVQDLEAYVKRAIVNRYLDRVRARRTWLRHAPRTVTPPDSADWTGDTLRRGEVRAALAALSPRQRACVVLRFYEDLPVAAIAHLLGCSEGAVKRHLSDSMTRLMARLGDNI